jgi:hypothetical protein
MERVSAKSGKGGLKRSIWYQTVRVRTFYLVLKELAGRVL